MGTEILSSYVPITKFSVQLQSILLMSVAGIFYINYCQYREHYHICTPGSEVIKLFLCLTQLSNRKIKKFFVLRLSDFVFIMLINVKMPTIVGILTFMSRINFMLI